MTFTRQRGKETVQTKVALPDLVTTLSSPAADTFHRVELDAVEQTARKSRPGDRPGVKR